MRFTSALICLSYIIILGILTISCGNDSSPSNKSNIDGAVSTNPTNHGNDGGIGNNSELGTSSDAGKSSTAGNNPIGTDLPTTTGNTTADKLIQTALSCGYQSRYTVPAGWEMVLVGEQGCVVWSPPGWQALGAGTNITSIQEDTAGNTGYLSMMGVPQAGVYVECTPQGVTNFMKQFIEGTGCNNVQTLYYQEGTVNIAGVIIPKADFIFSCTSGQVRKVGYFWNTIQGTVPLCNLLILGFWMPETQITAQTCTLTQIFNSALCPGPGGTSCSDSECNSDCKARGNTGGQCDSNDNCQCH